LAEGQGVLGSRTKVRPNVKLPSYKAQGTSREDPLERGIALYLESHKVLRTSRLKL